MAKQKRVKMRDRRGNGATLPLGTAGPSGAAPCSFDAACDRFAAAAADGRVRVWDVASGRLVVEWSDRRARCCSPLRGRPPRARALTSRATRATSRTVTALDGACG